MHPHEMARLQRMTGALAPYRWEATYRDGTTLQEFGWTGHRRAAEIDRGRLKTLALIGHPSGSIALECAIPPDEIILQADTTYRLGTGLAVAERYVLFGFRWGLHEVVMAVDSAGRVLPWPHAVTNTLQMARLAGTS
jgi:hypothetical protein